MRQCLDINHAHSAIAILVAFRAFINAITTQTVADFNSISTLIDNMEEYLRKTAESGVAANWQVAVDGLRLLCSQLKCREIARNEGGDIVSEQARSNVLCQELRMHVTAAATNGIAIPMAANVLGEDNGIPGVEQLVSFLSAWPLPTTYWRRVVGHFPVQQESSATEVEDSVPSPLVRVIASIDGAPWVSPQLLRPQLLYSLRFTLHGIGWPNGTNCLRLDLLTTCPSNEYSVSTFALQKPASLEGHEYQSELAGQISFHSAQSILSDELSFVVRCAFELSGGRFAEVPVIGHNQLDFRVLSPDGAGVMSGYRRLDRHLVELLDGLLKSNPEVQTEMTELVPLLDALNCLLGVYAQGAVFKKIRTLREQEFQAAVIRDMRLRLGEDVQEHQSQAGGNTDIRYRGVIIELKVEHDNGDRNHIAQKYARQSVQYEGVEARQVSIVMVLDLTPKDDPPGDIRGDVLLVDVPTHGGADSAKPYPAKAFVFVVNGNICNPSDYSK